MEESLCVKKQVKKELKKINIPGIIGLILSGVAIGPHGLNILAKNSAVDLFSTIGLLYIMFIAGLELDMNEFKANRNKSLLFGFFTFRTHSGGVLCVISNTRFKN